jgi:hypothetical protein
MKRRQMLIQGSMPKKGWDAFYHLKRQPFSLASHEEELMCEVAFFEVTERNYWTWRPQ